MMMIMALVALVALSSYSSYCCAFVVNHHHHHSMTPTTNRLRTTTTPSSINIININNINPQTTTTTALFAALLSERQLQFWEDVEDGLDDIEDFYVKKYNQDIHRIRTFAKRARGELPLPTPAANGQEPSEEHVDGLTAQPFWNVTDNNNAAKQLFPWAIPLEEQAHVIIQEFETKLQQQQQQQQEQQAKLLFSADSVWQNQVMGQGWSAIRLQR
jgi:hypothetical protein